MQEHDRASIKVTEAAKAAGKSTNLDNAFDCKGYTCSLPEEEVLKLSRPATWHTCTPERLQLIALQVEAAIVCKGDWSRLQRHWLSQLLVPGSVVLDTSEEPRRSKLVLHSCQFGAILLRTPVTPGTEVIRIPEKPDIEFKVVEKIETWRVFGMHPHPPGTVEGIPGDIPCVKWDGKRSGLLAFAASRGLKGFTVPLLRKLALLQDGITEAMVSRARTEIALMRVLLRNIFQGEYNEKMLEHAMKQRHRDIGQAELEATKSLNDFGVVVEENEDDMADILEELEVLRAKRRAAATREAQISAMTTTAGAASSSAAGGHGGAPAASGAPARVRRWVPAAADGFDVPTAEQWVPPLCKLSKDGLRENRWRVRAPWLAGERSKSFGTGTGLSDYEAMVFVIRLAWAGYCVDHPGSCPWEFEDARPIHVLD